MKPKKQILTDLSLSKEVYTEEDFLRVHISLEGYVKHLLLIGLRLSGGQYQTARQVINHSRIAFGAKAIKLGFRLLGVEDNWTTIKQNNLRFTKLERLVNRYTRPVRNAIVHGCHYQYKTDEVALLYNIDRAYILEIERIVAKYNDGKTILKHTPTDFGATKGTIKHQRKLRRLLRVGMSSQPITYAKANYLYRILDETSKSPDKITL